MYMEMLKDGKFKTSSFSNVDPVPFCVAVARTENGRVLVKNSRDTGLKPLEFTEAEWAAFTKGVKAGEFDV